MKHPEDQAFKDGLQTRREVLGEHYVDRTLAAATDFSWPLQEHVTRQCWGTVWQRPGLDRRTRSLLTLAMLTALGKTQDLKGHVRGALNNGASLADIQEVFLHAAVYCGVPAAVDAFRSAGEVVDGPTRG